MTPTLLVIVLLATGSQSAPADDPVRIDLPVFDEPQASSGTQPAESLEPNNQPGADASNDQLIFANLISHKLQGATNILGSKLGSNPGLDGHQADFSGVFAVPVTARERARLEIEGFDSKPLSFKENIQNIVAGLFQPKPIVETIREEDKYGNTGDKFEFAGRAIVSGAEGVSNLVNSVLEVPGTIFRKITRAASEKLNNLGGKLIGLN